MDSKTTSEASYTAGDIIRASTVIDDIMFRRMAKDPDFMQEILRAILGDPLLTVIESRSQEDISPITGRGIVVDCLCRSTDGRIINVEVQKGDKGVDHQRRVRYHSSLITVENTGKGTKFSDVPDVTVVYICGFDIFGLGKAMYEIERVIAGTTEKRYNGFREIYLTPSEDSTDISELMKVFTESDCYSERFPVTSDLKRYYKTIPEGIDEMNFMVDEYIDKAREEAREEGLAEGRAEGREEGRAEGREEERAEMIEKICLSVISGGIAREAAISVCGLTEDEFDLCMKKVTEKRALQNNN